MRQPKKSNTGLVFAIGAGLGAIAGAVAGVLTAPKSGKETRADLEREGKKAIANIKKQSNKVAKHASEDVDTMTAAAKTTHAAKTVKKVVKKAKKPAAKKPAAKKTTKTAKK